MAGNATIGALHVKLGLDTAQFEQGLRKTQASLKGLSFANVAGAAAGATAVTALTTAFVALRNAMQFGDEIADTAKRIGVSTDALQEYRYAVKALGGEFGDADKALEGFQKTFSAASSGFSKKAVKAFEALRLDPKAFATWEDALDAAIDKIGNLKSVSDQTFAAQKLGIESILPAIRDGTAAFNDQRRAAHNLGLVMDKDVVAKLGDANDQFEVLAQKLNIQVKTALANLAPTLIEGVTALVDLTTNVNDLIGKLDELNKWKPSQALLTLLGGGPVKQEDTIAWKIGTVTGLGLYGDSFRKMGIGNRRPDLSGSQFEAPNRSFTVGIPKSGTLADVSTGGGRHGPRDRTDDAIAAAARDELRARLDLVDDIEKQAELRLQEINDEERAAKRQLNEDISSGSVKESARKTIEASIERETATKRAALAADTSAKLAEQEIAKHETLNRYYDEIAHIQENAAATAEEQNRIATKALNDRQQIEKDRLKSDQDAALARNAAAKLVATKLMTDQEAERLAQDALHTAEQAAQARDNLRRTYEEEEQRAQDALDLQVDLLQGQADLAQSGYERAKVELRILALQQEEERRHLEQVVALGKLAGYTDQQVGAARQRLAVLPEIHRNERDLVRVQDALIDSFNDLAGAIDSMKGAFKSGDVAGGLSSLGRTLKELSGLSGSTSGLGKLLGTASSTASGFAAIAAASKAIFGSSFGLIGKLLSDKPSNKGAGFDLITGQFSGDRRDDETEAAVKQAGEAILQAQETLKAAGLVLNETIRGLVIGGRDPSQIYTSSGKTITSAVGDPAAAAEAALRAVLQGAGYVSDAQKKLVDDMLAAGKGFDDIATALQGFAAAQELGQALQDQILQLTDPQKYDTLQVNRAADAQAKAFKEAADAGYLTADQLSALNADLATLRGLQLDEVLKKYADAANDNLDIVEFSNQMVADAQDALRQAFEDTAADLEDVANRFGSIAKSLGLFRRGLDSGPAAALSPEEQYKAAKAAFDDVSRRAQLGDEEALGELQDVSQAYLDASKAYYGSSEKYFADLAVVKDVVSRAEGVAERQAAIAQQQLIELKNTVSQLIQIEQATLSVRDAIAALGAALAMQRAVTPSLLPTTADGLLGLGGTGGATTDEFSNLPNGLLSLLSDTPGFATGGFGQIRGPGGIDRAIANMRISNGEWVGVSKEDPSSWGHDASTATYDVGRATLRLLSDIDQRQAERAASLDRRISALERATRAQAPKKIVVKR
jgi:hypothetical protein